MANWNVFEIAKMEATEKLLNFARQLEQEAVDWGRAFFYRGKPVRQYVELGSRVSVVKGGGFVGQWVQVCKDGEPIGDKIKVVRGSAGRIYKALYEAE